MREKPFALSAKVVIRDASGRCLLLRRSMSSKHNGGKWDLPGGKTDAGENFDVALLREVAEETGLSISLDRVIGAAESELPDRKVAYMILEGCLVSGQVRLSEEHDDFAWVLRPELGAMDVCDQFRDFLMAYAAASDK